MLRWCLHTITEVQWTSLCNSSHQQACLCHLPCMWGSCLTLKFILFMMLALTRSYEVLGEYSGLGRTHFPSNCCQDHNHVLQISCCTWRWESSSCCKAAFKFYLPGSSRWLPGPVLLWSYLPLHPEEAWALASVESLLKTFSISSSLNQVQRCLHVAVWPHVSLNLPFFFMPDLEKQLRWNLPFIPFENQCPF